jgi:xylan 1,4-beta-xylosidase
MKQLSCLLRSGVILALLSTGCAHSQQSSPYENYYSNPILAGDFPDPSIFRDGDNYYMTHSSFEYYPGLLIWHSTDLVNWTPVVHALRENVGSVWAPEFLKHEDTYYIYFPVTGVNWVISAPSPEGPWSDPVRLDVSHIDPGHVVGRDGKRYLHFSSGYVVALSDDGLSIEGEPFHSYHGWEIPDEWNVACFCLESPKLFFKNDMYYLTSAQGGTVGPPTAHMAVSARSPNIEGPWENSPYNPIVHTYENDETWHAKGHGTVLDDANGNWWIVYHGYKKGFYTLGRHTLMEPIEWTEDGWFKVPEDVQTDQPIPTRGLAAQRKPLSLSDDFQSDKLGLQWSFYRSYEPSRVQVGGGELRFEAKGNNPGNSSPLIFVPRDKSYEMTIQYELEGTSTGGLVLFYNQTVYAGLVTDGNGFTIYRRGQSLNHGRNPLGRTGYLKIRNEEHIITFYYSTDGQDWKKIQRSFSTEGYHHESFGGFVSLRTGVVSMGEGSVIFRDFNYSALD